MTGHCRSAIGPILVVEDDDEIRDFVSAMLMDAGYAVAVAPNGAVALDMAERRAPRAILLDMKMPIMDGWEFARQYHARRVRAAPIIVMTAAHDAAKRASDVHAVGLLNKPFEMEDLLSTVARVVCEAEHEPRRPTDEQG